MIALRNKAPRWPSLARWSAASVACTAVTTRIPPSIDADPLCRLAETDEGHLRWIDDAEDRVDAFVAKVGDRDGRVRHLRTPQREGTCPRHKVGEIIHQFVELLFWDVVDGRRDEATATQRDPDPDVNSVRGLEPVVSPKSVELAEPLRSDADSLQQQDGRQYPFVDRTLCVSRGQPGQCVFQDDFVGKVIVRNLPFGSAHRGRDRLPHLSRAVGRRRFTQRLGLRLGGCLLGSGGVLDVAYRDCPLRTGAAHRVDIDGQALGQAARGR